MAALEPPPTISAARLQSFRPFNAPLFVKKLRPGQKDTEFRFI
jgi:hypothetical protein